MLDRFKQIAITLRWFKPIALLLMLSSLVIVGYVLIGKSGIAADDYYLIPSILTALWSFSVFWSLHIFPSIPAKPNKSLGFFKRVFTRLKRFAYYIITIIAIGLSLTIVVFTIRALRVWGSDFS
ncbi:MAG: hypothetical protein ACPG8A_03440 [Psychrobium sp.]